MYYNNTTNTNRGFWPWVAVQTIVRPDRTTPAVQKDETYHAKCARYYLGSQQDQYANWYRACYSTNLAYGIDNRWGEQEDIRTFLGDGADQTTRVALKFPIIRPMLTRLTGAVDNISISAEAHSATQYAKTRKESAFAQAMLYSQAAAAGPMMAGAYAPMGISPDEDRTQDTFENTYQDQIIKGANSLMSMIALKNRIKEKKRMVAERMALSGLAAAHCSVVGKNLVWEFCDPLEIGWDTSCLEPDFTDAEYAFVCPLMTVSSIGEKYQPKKAQITALDKWANTKTNGGVDNLSWPQMRPRVFTVYWRDMDYVERGFVMKDGEPWFCTINEPNPDRRDGKPEYTDADLIEPPESKYTATWTDAEWSAKKQRKAIEVVRYCSLIPWEYLPGAYTRGMPFSQAKPPADYADGVTGDMIFDWGKYPLQEADPDDAYSVKFPIKFQAWSYLAGYVVAPLTAAISPQRVMNQVTSDVMWRLRKAGNKSTAIAQEAVAGSSMTEQEILMALKEGDPIIVPAQALGGVQNATREIDTSPGNSFYQMFNLLPQLKGIAESSIGVYEQNYGAPTGQDQLVGTLQLQLQQAGVMQQPFYAAIAGLFKQIHQFDAQAGKQFYSRMPWALADMVGEEDMEALVMTKDWQLEQLRVEIDLTVDAEQMKTITNQNIIPMLLQMQMLDPQTASRLMAQGSFPKDAYREAARFTQQAAEAAKAMAEQQAQQQQQAALAMEQQSLMQQQDELYQQQLDASLKARDQDVKITAPERQALSEWMKPQETETIVTA